METLIYDGDSGALTWKRRGAEQFGSKAGYRLWNYRYAGKSAGTKTFNADGSAGGITLRLDNVTYRAHRLIWELLYGAIPEGRVIDHINGNPFDNRITNIRMCTPQQNRCNTKLSKANVSGFKGVSFRPKEGKWRAAIGMNGRRITIGSYRTIDEARSAYKKKSLQLHVQFARTT